MTAARPKAPANAAPSAPLDTGHEASQSTGNLPLPKAEDSARTLAHRMADELGGAIVNGELTDGARIREEELASHYRVSRSPVREAIALLERRGLVRTEPRRGTYVVGFTPNLIADLFNVRGALMGLATRYVALQRSAQALAELRAISQALQHAATQADITPLQYARQASELGHTVLRHCGSDVLRRMVSDHGHLSSWGLIWRQRPIDFLTPERRLAMAADYDTLCQRIAQGDDSGSEQWMRKMLDDNRDSALRELAVWRGGQVAPMFQLRPSQS